MRVPRGGSVDVYPGGARGNRGSAEVINGEASRVRCEQAALRGRSTANGLVPTPPSLTKGRKGAEKMVLPLSGCLGRRSQAGRPGESPDVSRGTVGRDTARGHVCSPPFSFSPQTRRAGIISVALAWRPTKRRGEFPKSETSKWATCSRTAAVQICLGLARAAHGGPGWGSRPPNVLMQTLVYPPPLRGHQKNNYAIPSGRPSPPHWVYHTRDGRWGGRQADATARKQLPFNAAGDAGVGITAHR